MDVGKIKQDMDFGKRDREPAFPSKMKQKNGDFHLCIVKNNRSIQLVVDQHEICSNMLTIGGI